MEIQLGKGKYTAVFDDDFYRRHADWVFKVSNKSRSNNKHVYVEIRLPRTTKTYAAHRLVVGAKLGEIVDHINGNSLDNRADNLRICTQKENSINRRKSVGVFASNYIGVTKTQWLWQARIRRGSLTKSFSSKNEHEAAALKDLYLIESKDDIATTSIHRDYISAVFKKGYEQGKNECWEIMNQQDREFEMLNMRIAELEANLGKMTALNKGHAQAYLQQCEKRSEFEKERDDLKAEVAHFKTMEAEWDALETLHAERKALTAKLQKAKDWFQKIHDHEYADLMIGTYMKWREQAREALKEMEGE